MLKTTFFAVASMMILSTSAMANDDLLSMVANLENAPATESVDEATLLGRADVAELLGEEDNDEQDAIAACFRRISYGHHSHSYGSYGGHHSYSNNWCSPVRYSYHYSYPTYCCAPVTYSYQCYTPCYTQYWGCY